MPFKFNITFTKRTIMRWEKNDKHYWFDFYCTFGNNCKNPHMWTKCLTCASASCLRTSELKSWACHSSQSSLSVYKAFSVTQSTGPLAICCVRALTIRYRCWPTLSCTDENRYWMFLDQMLCDLFWIKNTEVSNLSAAKDWLRQISTVFRIKRHPSIIR